MALADPPVARDATVSGARLDYDLWSYGAMIVRNWRSGAVAAGCVLAFGIIVVLLLGADRTYSSSASFYPQAPRESSSGVFAGLAAQYGLGLSGAPGSDSPQFYEMLLTSRRLLSAVVEAEYRILSDSGETRQTLTSYYLGGKVKPEALAREEAVKELRRSVDVGVKRETGLVELTVRSPQAALSRQIAERMIAEVHAHNLTVRQTNAAAERRFVTERLEEARRELHTAEAALEEFLRENRQYVNSPELTFAAQRLQRELSMHQQSVVSLTQALQQARIEEVRNTPVITVLEMPNTPIRPDATGRLWVAAGFVVLAGIVGLAASFTIALLSNQKGAGTFKEFRSALRDVRSELKHAVGRSSADVI